MATESLNYKVLQIADATGSFPTIVPTVTEPTGTGVIQSVPTARQQGGPVADTIFLIPFGTGADDSTFDIAIIGWRLVGTLWTPIMLARVTCTLSATVGVAGQNIDATHRLSDLQSIVVGNVGVDVSVGNPGNDFPGWIIVDAKGFSKLQVIFNLSTATGANALYAPV